MKPGGGTPEAGSDARRIEGLLRAQRDLALELTAVTELTAALEVCLKAAMEVSGMDSGGIYLFDSERKSLDLACSIGLSAEFVRMVSHYGPDTPNVELVLRASPFFLSREQVEAHPDPAPRREGLKVIGVVPFGRDGKVIGCLNVSARTLEEVTPHSRHALEALAAQIGSSVARLEAEARLRRSEARYRWLTENLTDVVWTSDLSLRQSYVSPSVFGQRGFTPEEVLAQTPEQIMTPESLLIAQAALAAKLQGDPADYARPVTLGLAFWCKDGSTVPVEIKAALSLDENGAPSGIVGVTRDISERRRAEAERAAMEEQLRQAQKMEAIGTLAGGVAHDFNNLLTAIVGSASVMKLRLPSDSDLLDDLQRIESASQRASELTRQLLGFARKGKLSHEVVDLHAIAVEVISILKHTIDKRIRIDFENHAATAVVMGDPGQVEQVVLNLAVNASEAMPDGGVLTVSTNVVDLDGEAAAGLGVSPGPYVVTSVADTGPGIPEEIRARVFEPFFTTKPMGKGTGMGLAVAYGIAENHGGALTVEDSAAGGAAIALYLPAAEARHRQPQAPGAAPVRGKGRILVVDDERVVRETLEQVLRLLGYEVASAHSGSEALARCGEPGSRPDLIILDLSMPGMNGRECLRELLARDPTLRILVSTGHVVDGQAAELVQQGAVGVLDKPYAASELADAVAAALLA